MQGIPSVFLIQMIYKVFPRPRTTFYLVAAKPLVYTQLQGWRDCRLWMLVGPLSSKHMGISPFCHALIVFASTFDVSEGGGES